MNLDTSKKNMADDVVRYVAWKGQRARVRVLWKVHYDRRR